ncbi:hypothetical protein NK6_1460 [Bradyrhizobium diazoefficiens]|uniref:Uncharacterized protein n=1 Tax=Bradyrhizobium diazoefficiens TaxID=1355477 RepID=A0A0E4BLP0_9BRAD|nr:hypothetical protein NK6_1460 [Bradyrhizobium diazoefficiens]
MDGSDLARQSHALSRRSVVMPGLVPGIHESQRLSCKTWMHRHSVYRVPSFLKEPSRINPTWSDKPGHDE